MKYLNGNILCLESFEFIKTDRNPDGLIAKGTYDSLKSKGKITVHGRGGNGSQVLIEYDSLPQMYKGLVNLKFGGDPYEYMAKQPIRDCVKPDHKAIRFFESYRLPDGRALKEKNRIEYANNASILNALCELMSDKKALKEKLKTTLDKFWKTAGEVVKDLNNEYPHSLPTSERRLKPLFKEYKQKGYEVLVSDKHMNENRRKVDGDLERLILSLYVQQNKPYAKDVHEIYQRFLAGELDVVDVSSGEVFNPEKFYKDGYPVEISETTVWTYINKPLNRAAADKLRTSSLEYNSKRRPHIHRHAPVYALSKITMDDIMIPFKMPDGTRIWSYQIFDVASGCVIGRSFGRDKNSELFLEAVNDMFRQISVQGWGLPAEIEIEQHISNTFADTLLKEGSVFPFVRFCRGGNPQEKRAEGFIRGKKYQQQSKREGFQRRPFARLEANRMNEDKDTVRYKYDAVLANEISDIERWNNSLHPNQDKFLGMTRWQVLCESQNPDLLTPDPAVISRYIGYKSETSISRSQYVTVKRLKYHLPNVECLDRLQPNNLSVDAYYIPDENGTTNEVHLYQGEEFICSCTLLQTFNESKAEQTDTDISIRNNQFAYRQSFDTAIAEKVNKLSRKVHMYENKEIETAAQREFENPEMPLNNEETEPEMYDETDNDSDYWTQRAMDDL